MTKLAAVVLVAFGLLASAAQAAPPTNDDRGSAQALAVPSTVRGTTVDATDEAGEPFASCAGSSNSVWYAIGRAGSTSARDLVIELDAAGDLDAVVEVYRRTRSQLAPVTCGQTLGYLYPVQFDDPNGDGAGPGNAVFFHKHQALAALVNQG